MQKIFIIIQDVKETSEDGNFLKVNEFIGDTGKVISVTAQNVSSGPEGTGYRGRWLVVADDGGKTLGEEKILP